MSTCNMSVIVNGKPGNSFKATRSLSQDDPLSPFLFIMGADVLGTLIDRAKDLHLVDNFKVGRDIACVWFSFGIVIPIKKFQNS